MKKKKIFISMHYMELGGAEISLIGLLQALDYSKYDVDLFIHSHQGELMQFIPKEVNILPENREYALVEKPMVEVLKASCLRLLWARLKAKYQFKKYMKKTGVKQSAAIYQYIGDAVTPILPSLHFLGEYDLAISFLNPHNIVRDKVKAKKKACWIHTDYSRIDIDIERELPVWASYDYVISISPEVGKSFTKVFPSLSNQIVEIENILSPVFVRKRAKEFDVYKEMPKEPGIINILSVGRFSDAKNYDNVPEICKKINVNLNADGVSKLNVRWYLIGYGGDEDLIRNKISEAGMENYVIILGKRSNPYPYIEACDIYAQPSRYEGKSVTVREAQMLCKPVVVTNYPTAKSQIKNGVDGAIVPLNIEDCAQGMADFIRKKKLQDDIIGYLQTHDFGNLSEAKKIDNLV